MCFSAAASFSAAGLLGLTGIATLVPAYHEGHAVYWWHGYWHYRDPHGAWAYYHEEPAFLRDWRAHHAVEYHHYGRR